jgi:hypothetical protein
MCIKTIWCPSRIYIGKGPRYNKLTNSVDVSNLEGGYVTYKWNLPKNQLLYPFAKFQYYDGGNLKKMLEVIR